MTIKVEHSENDDLDDDAGGASGSEWNLRKVNVTADQSSAATPAQSQDIIFLKEVTATACSALHDDDEPEPELTEATEQAPETEDDHGNYNKNHLVQISSESSEEIDLKNPATMSPQTEPSPSTSRSAANRNENKDPSYSKHDEEKPGFSGNLGQGGRLNAKRAPSSLWNAHRRGGKALRPLCPVCRRDHFIKDCPRNRFSKRRR